MCRQHATDYMASQETRTGAARRESAFYERIGSGIMVCVLLLTGATNYERARLFSAVACTWNYYYIPCGKILLFVSMQFSGRFSPLANMMKSIHK
jgi:hypothetical protein